MPERVKSCISLQEEYGAVVIASWIEVAIELQNQGGACYEKVIEQLGYRDHCSRTGNLNRQPAWPP